MTAADIAARLQDRFGEAIAGVKLDAIDPFVVLSPVSLVPICGWLRDDPAMRFDLLNCITGVDYLETDAKRAAKAGFEPHLEVVYHMSSTVHRHRFVLKVNLPRWADGEVGHLPQLPTVSGVWATADWHERETFDLCGVTFAGHPDLRRILLAEDWDGYPLRKDYEYPLEYHDIRCR